MDMSLSVIFVSVVKHKAAKLNARFLPAYLVKTDFVWSDRWSSYKMSSDPQLSREHDIAVNKEEEDVSVSPHS